MQNQPGFSFSSPQQLVHQLGYLLIFVQTIARIQVICRQKSRRPHQFCRHIHSQESAKMAFQEITIQSIKETHMNKRE